MVEAATVLVRTREVRTRCAQFLSAPGRCGRGCNSVVRTRVVRTRLTWRHGTCPCVPGMQLRTNFAFTPARRPFLLMRFHTVLFRQKKNPIIPQEQVPFQTKEISQNIHQTNPKRASSDMKIWQWQEESREDEVAVRRREVPMSGWRNQG